MSKCAHTFCSNEAGEHALCSPCMRKVDVCRVIPHKLWVWETHIAYDVLKPLPKQQKNRYWRGRKP